jgi:hypothetical protein
MACIVTVSNTKWNSATSTDESHATYQCTCTPSPVGRSGVTVGQPMMVTVRTLQVNRMSLMNLYHSTVIMIKLLFMMSTMMSSVMWIIMRMMQVFVSSIAIVVSGSSDYDLLRQDERLLLLVLYHLFLNVEINIDE